MVWTRLIWLKIAIREGFVNTTTDIYVPEHARNSRLLNECNILKRDSVREVSFAGIQTFKIGQDQLLTIQTAICEQID
jgi:hypothetical protein